MTTPGRVSVWQSRASLSLRVGAVDLARSASEVQSPFGCCGRFSPCCLVTPISRYDRIEGVFRLAHRKARVRADSPAWQTEGAASMIRHGILTSVIFVAGLASAQAQKLSKAEIGKRGKAATVFVEIAGRGSGSAFCVHPSGFFITNEHVVHGVENAEITLILNPTLKEQRVLKAKVVRADKDRDLVLLRVDGEQGLPTLPLGTD